MPEKIRYLIIASSPKSEDYGVEVLDQGTIENLDRENAKKFLAVEARARQTARRAHEVGHKGQLVRWVVVEPSNFYDDE